MNGIAQHFRVLPEIREALQQGRPVVALESSIIAHGMPYPLNIETALACEAIIREHNAVPATIAVKEHRVCIGLGEDEIAALGDKKSSRPILKLSRKDLSYALVQGHTGATTVAATMIAAHKAGLHIFATGGIGGVHRGAETSMDISADLEELSKTPIAVVCAGAKSILDIGLTLEVLETKGVPIIGFQTNELPGFFCRTTGFTTDCVAQDAGEIARLLKTHWDITENTGALVANPVPHDVALAEDEVTRLIDAALIEATRQNIRHKAVTPFLLSFIAKMSGSRTLDANIALVKNNAALAADIAAAFSSRRPA